MRFVLDQNLKRGAARWFEEQGLDAVHVADHLTEEAPDADIVAFALRQGRIIVTRDRDFEALPAPASQVVLVRLGNCSNAVLIEAWETAWPAAQSALIRGDRLVEVFPPR